MSGSGINLESTVAQNQAIVASDIGNEKVMMSLEHGEYYGLEPVGSRIWEMLAAPVQVSAIVDHLLGQYEVDRVTCERDVLAFLAELEAARIIVAAP